MTLDIEQWKSLALATQVKIKLEPDNTVHVFAPSLLRLAAFVILAGRQCEDLAEKGPRPLFPL